MAIPNQIEAGGDSREWLVELEGTRHRVAINSRDSTRTFSVDDVRHTGGFFARNPRITTFDIAGHAASLNVTLVAPSTRSNLKRMLPASGRSLPRVLLAYIFGGEGVGGGVAAASMVDSIMYVRCTVFELVVDGLSRGSWVAIPTGDGVTVTWKFVKPGEPFS